MSEWHEHLGEPLRYEESELVARYEENPWAQSAHKVEPTGTDAPALDDCLKLSKLLAKHFPPGLIVQMAVALETAEQKHPVFAEGLYGALGVLAEEYSELVKAVTKNEGDERVKAEAMDLLTVVLRFVRGDWIMQESAQGDPV